MTVQEFAEEIRKWWSFDDGQRHTHSWHSREDFIAKKLPELFAAIEDEKFAYGQDQFSDGYTEGCRETEERQ